MGHGTGSVLPHRLQACVLPRGKISLLQFISRLKAGNVTAWLLLHCRGMQFMWKSAASTLSYHTAKSTACWGAGGGFAMLTEQFNMLQLLGIYALAFLPYTYLPLCCLRNLYWADSFLPSNLGKTGMQHGHEHHRLALWSHRSFCLCISGHVLLTHLRPFGEFQIRSGFYFIIFSPLLIFLP